MRPALLGRALVRAGVCARPTHRSLGERFFRRMLDKPVGSDILSTSVYTNTAFVWRTCSHTDLPMPAYARRDIVDEDRVGVYHCTARCVRRAFLCGADSYTGRDYANRKAWVLDRLRQLAGLFGVEVCDYAVMSNHLHIVLRNRPDVARGWSDDEVAIRWRKLFPQRDELTGEPREPDGHDVAMLTADADRLAVLRSRLASLSWFLCEWVARKANHEEGSFGRFGAGRFKSQPLLDESALRNGSGRGPNNSQLSRARRLRGTFRVRRRPAACPARRSIRRRSACSCVGSGVSADRHPKVRHAAARLDRPGDP